MSGELRYAAFISYAHADEIVATKLHKALETYQVPKTLKLAAQGTLSPIFRDAAELTAHHSLPEKIREAVDGSRFLIVLCSPAAKKSHWVNEEIRLFREIHGEGAILCVLCEGGPETSFPPALREGGREPLAANLGTTRESFRLGVTQLAASMMGVGLDQLIQRDSKRRRGRARLLTAGSMMFAALMGGMAWTAVNARDAAEVSRTEAEKMVEFMLTNLKQDLEPVGKLDILDDVGNRVTDYYKAIPFSDMDDDRLARQARARHLLGQVAIDQGKMEKAKAEIDAAYKATEEVLRRNIGNTDAIFAHAQSAYWLGEMSKLSKDYDTTLKNRQEYNKLASLLYQNDSRNFDWIMEAAWGQNNLGWVFGKLGNYKASLDHFNSAINLLLEAKKIKSTSRSVKIELANALAGKASAEKNLEQYEDALNTRIEEVKLLEALLEKNSDIDAKYYLLLARLNYWEVENSINQICNYETPFKLLEDSKTFHEQDSSNYLWKINYFNYSYSLISQCQKDIPRNEIDSHIEELFEYAKLIGFNDKAYAKKLASL